MVGVFLQRDIEVGVTGTSTICHLLYKRLSDRNKFLIIDPITILSTPLFHPRGCNMSPWHLLQGGSKAALSQG